MKKILSLLVLTLMVITMMPAVAFGFVPTRTLVSNKTATETLLIENTVVIDLNGHTLTFEDLATNTNVRLFQINEGGNLTIKNGTIKYHSSDDHKNGVQLFFNSGTLTLEKVTCDFEITGETKGIELSICGIYNQFSNLNLVMNNSKLNFTVSNAKSNVAAIMDCGSSTDITGSEVVLTATTTDSNSLYGVYNYLGNDDRNQFDKNENIQNSKITINGYTCKTISGIFTESYQNNKATTNLEDSVVNINRLVNATSKSDYGIRAKGKTLVNVTNTEVSITDKGTNTKADFIEGETNSILGKIIVHSATVDDLTALSYVATKSEIKLTKNATLSDVLTNVADNELTIDLNGYNIDLNKQYIYNLGELHLINTSANESAICKGEGMDISGAHYGGAIFSYGKVYLDNISFVSNKADNGGSIFSNNYLSINNCTFDGISSGINSMGGAILNFGTMDIKSSVFKNLISKLGGAIFDNNNNTTTIEKSTFTDCKSLDGEGGVIFAGQDAKTIEVKDTNFVNCIAGKGGAYANYPLFGQDGKPTKTHYSVATFTNCNFINCGSIQEGGAIKNSCIVNLVNTDFVDCYASSTDVYDLGGAIYSSYILNAKNCNFKNCTAGERGAAVFNDGRNEISKALYGRGLQTVFTMEGGTITGSKVLDHSAYNESIYARNSKVILKNVYLSTSYFVNDDNNGNPDNPKCEIIVINDTMENSAPVVASAERIEQYGIPTVYIGENKPEIKIVTLSNTYQSEDNSFSATAPIIIEQNRTFLGIRDMATVLGVAAEAIKWDDTTKTATISKSGATIAVTQGSNIIKLTYKGYIYEIKNDVSAINKNDRIYLPFRVIFELFGYTVDWNAETRTITCK